MLIILNSIYCLSYFLFSILIKDILYIKFVFFYFVQKNVELHLCYFTCYFYNLTLYYRYQNNYTYQFFINHIEVIMIKHSFMLECSAAPSVCQKWTNSKGEVNNWISCEKSGITSEPSVPVGTALLGHQECPPRQRPYELISSISKFNYYFFLY